ncbi:HalOD1 output domain-containing protein [Salinigranum marinum]|uniref:HalOD1 output domain-containing protein n=1 Tax=Salinigranum marinum TaxID=1515595 RepID=UPI002989C7D7|nr:HalOD1 output domain-containing protein [Salinigranum marinum]
MLRSRDTDADDDSQKNLHLLVVEEIARHKGVPPVRLHPPLYSVIDPDALDAVLANDTSESDSLSLTVSFEYDGCVVKVDSTHDVEVVPSDEASER